jgi:hypothetical protein
MLRNELTILGTWDSAETFCWELDPSKVSIEDQQIVDAFCSAHNLRQMTLADQTIPSDHSHQTAHPREG